MDMRVFRQVSLFSRRRRPKFFLLSLTGYCDYKRAISFSFNDKFQLLVKMLFSFFAVSILNNKKGFLFLFFFLNTYGNAPCLEKLSKFHSFKLKSKIYMLSTNVNKQKGVHEIQCSDRPRTERFC